MDKFDIDKDFDNPELKKIFSLSTRDNGAITIADVIRYEADTDDHLGRGFRYLPNSRVIPAVIREAFGALFPEFQASKKEINEVSNTEYVADFAWYIVNRIKENKLDGLNDLFLFCELVLIESSEEGHKMMTDFLEDFQSVFLNLKIPLDKINVYLKPTTKQWWNEIDRFWKAAGMYIKSKPDILSE
jgi:hypothetical protein